MAAAETIVPPGSLVLITGVNGFIALHISNLLLKQGYAVHCSVRSLERSAWVQEAFVERHPSGTFSIIQVADGNSEGAWEKAIAGVDGIVHVAGDVSFGADPNQIIKPMVKGHFIFTSSDRAALNPIPGKEFIIDPNLWNDPAIHAAWRPPPYKAYRGCDVYAALKAQFEQEVWRFSKEESPQFVVNTIFPDFTVGPIFHPKQTGSTGKLVMDFWRDLSHYELFRKFIPQRFVDVGDTTLLHVAALTQEDFNGERLWGFAAMINFNSWVGWPEDDSDQGYDLSKIDTSRGEELLKRFGQDEWTSFFPSAKRNVLDTLAAWPS
ncbi:NAD(P)-binding protein [Periconia macrospinosa]|uniref:NAD(P)-binding protein n=1 Tax=Periconia macrospinosa TaxID=97972 RepID=A0A2V1DPG7_9PLEO|nr:NAD(P)-binding protein [Periconia macrospinosa]